MKSIGRPSFSEAIATAEAMIAAQKGNGQMGGEQAGTQTAAPPPPETPALRRPVVWRPLLLSAFSIAVIIHELGRMHGRW